MKENTKKMPKKFGLFAFVLISIVSVITLAIGLGTKIFKTNVVNKPYLLEGEEFNKPQMAKHRKDDNGDGSYIISLEVTGETEKTINKVNVIVIFDTSNSMNYPTESISATGRYGYNSSDKEWRRLYSRNSNGTYSEIQNNTTSGTVYYRNNGNYIVYNGPRYTSNTAGKPRIDEAQLAVNELANALLSKNGEGDNPDDMVQMALINFGTDSTTINFGTNTNQRYITTSYTEFSNKVNGLTPNGGTNWEAALEDAGSINFGDTDQTFVIFVSDGNPTFHRNDGGYDNWNRTYQQYGTGQETNDNIANSYEMAKDDAAALVTNGYQFFTIGAYGNVTRMQSLTTDAGAPAANYYSAENTEQLQQALQEILAQIELAGFDTVSIEDGTTQNVTISSKPVSLLTVDESSYRYYRKAADGDWVEWTVEDGAPEAELVNGSVNWNLNSIGLLENGVTYKVEFDCWPSQTTYDLIADLKQGRVDYSELEATTGPYAGLSEYIHKNGDSYTLDTNTTAVLKYTDTREENPELHTVLFDNPPAVETDADKILIHKQWENDYDVKEEDEIKININRDGEFYESATLDRDHEWEEGPIYIAAGLIREKYDANGNVTLVQVLEPGHDFTFQELGEESYNWEMIAQTIHPMIINDTLYELILIDRATSESYVANGSNLTEYKIPDAMNNDKTLMYYKEGNNEYYRLEKNSDKVYVKSGTNPTIEAYNFRRSNLNIQKIVDGESANPDDEFEFTIKVNDEGLSSGENLWFSVWDGDYVVLGDRLESEGWTVYVNEKNETYYFGKNNAELKVKLKAGENLRFTNLTTQATFDVVETDPSSINYSYTRGEFKAWYGSGEDSIEIKELDYNNENPREVSGKITLTNTSFYVYMTNTYELVDVEVEKEFDDANNQDAIRPEKITVNLFANGETAKDTEGNDIDPVEITIDATGKGSYKFEDLPRFNASGDEITYTVTEDEVTDYTTSIKDTRETDKDGNITTVGKFKYKITNTHTPETTNKTVVKVWEDDNDRDVLRPDSITLTLKADGNAVTITDAEGNTSNRTVTLNDDNGWTETIEDLPKYKNVNNVQTEIVYSWDEPEVTGYTQNTPVVDDDTITITNVHEIATKDTKVTKAWEDQNNRDNVRPTTIVMTLYDDKNQVVTFKDANNNEVSTVTLSGTTNEWTQTVTGLPMYRKNIETGAKEEIKYHWEENTSSLTNGYSKTSEATSFDVETETSVEDQTRIVNSRTTNTKTITVTKVWVDENNRDNKRTNAVITLNADGVATSNILTTLTDETATYTVPVNKVRAEGADFGGAIVYTVSEAEIPEYTTAITGNETAGFTVTNTHTIDTKNITVTKVWVDENNRDNKRTNAVITLKADNETAQAIKTDGTKEDAILTTLEDETVTFKVPVNKVREAGADFGGAITYTVSEAEIPEYTTAITGNETAGFTVTNTHTIDTKDIKVSKVWNDDNNRDGIRSNAVITLKADNETAQAIKTDGTKEDAILTTLEDETVTFKVPVNKVREAGADFGGAITYTVEEVPITVPTDWTGTGYTTAITGNETAGFTVTNTHNPEKASKTVTKVWDDESDIEGFRPETVTIDLYANDTKVTDVTPTMTKSKDGNTWTYVYADMYEYENGQPITYTISEDQVANYEEPDIDQDTLTVTNSRTVVRDELIVTKVWDDESNVEGFRPKTISVKLFANSEEVKNATPTITKDGNTWKLTYDNLPVYENGEVIDYTVTETPVANYNAPVINNDTLTITNTRVPGRQAITVTKVWDDESDIEGFRPETVTIDLYANDTKVTDVTPTMTKSKDGNTWTYVYDNMLINEGGEPITYTISEDQVPNYDEPDINQKTLTVTNSRNVSRVSVNAEKKWVDNNNQDGLVTADTSVIIILLADGEETVTKEANASNNWKVTFENLPESKNGKKVEYSVKEDKNTIPSGYESNVTGDMKKGFVVTNTHTPATTEATFTKVWEDADNHDGMRPDSIPLTLKGDGKVVNATPTITKDGNTWTIKYTGLPKYAGTKTPIVYTIEEGEVEHYQGVVKDNTITNTHTPETVDIPVVKEWHDNSNQDGIRPTTVTITLYADGVATSSATFGGEGNVWNYTFEGLDKYTNVDNKSHEIVYTIDEVENDVPSGYTKSKDGLKITNTHETATTVVEGTKIWNDDDNRDGLRPGSITISLLANGKPATYNDGKKVETYTATSEGGWTYKFEGLPKYENGTAITYSVSESDVEGYSPEIIVNSDYNIDIKNTHESAKVTISGTKVWDDVDDQDGKRPESITIKLMVGDEAIQSTNVTADDDWAWSFTDLPKNENGKPINYSIVEVQVDEYNEPVVEKVPEKDYEYTVTNTHTPEKVSFTINKDWRDDDDRDGIRPDKIIINILANGEPAKYSDGKVVPEQVITDADKWAITIENLPKYSKGKQITYSFTEVVVEGYETEIVPNEENPTSVTIINTHKPEETEIDITKAWEEDQFYLDRRPDMIEVDIYADGVYLDTIKVRKEDNWTAKVTNLYKYNKGTAITYTIKEKEVPEGYVSQVAGSSEDGYTITNIFVDGEGCTDCEEPPATRIDITFDNGEKYEEYYTFVTLLLGATALSSVRKFEM